MALFQGLCTFAHLPGGFRNRDLRPLIAGLLGLDPTTYTSGRMSYDLRRLRLKGLIYRVHGTTRYTVTTYGLHVALFSSNVYCASCAPAGLASPRTPMPSPAHSAMLSCTSIRKSGDSVMKPTYARWPKLDSFIT